MGKWLLKSNNISRSAFFWNAFSAVMNSFQTMVLLLVVTHAGTDNDSAWFVMAYAVGNLMLHVGKYGVRQFQVTDTSEKFSFSAYHRARIFSMLLLAASSAVYILTGIFFRGYESGKALVILLIVLLKAVEAYEDVYHGRMQQKGRLDVAGRILGIRLFLFLLLFSGLFLATKDLVLTTAVSVAAEAILSWCMNRSVMPFFRGEREEKGTLGGSWGILKECFPLAACMILNMYIANAPKYTIDTAVSSEVQTAFNIVFMPVFVIALLANFIYQPVLRGMGELWNSGERGAFRKRVGRLAALTAGMDLLLTALGTLVGIPVLELVYGVALRSYKRILMIFLLAGGVIALQNLLILAITILRMQRFMIFGYTGTALLYFMTDSLVMAAWDLWGLVIYYLILMLLLLLYSWGLYLLAWKKSGKELS